MTKIQKKIGFTLLEVIVALIVMSTVLLATFSMARNCTIAEHHNRMLLLGALLAERQLTLWLMEENPVYETQSGREDRFTWQLTAVPTNIENLAAVHLQVQWHEQYHPQTFDLLTLRQMGDYRESYTKR